MTSLRDLFLLDPQITYLNHGSFGACPKPVFETYQTWQRELERRPVEFLGRRITDLLAESRQHLAEFLNVERDEIVYFTNPTTAINMVARNLKLHPGDEILTTDHEYGAMDRAWCFNCRRSGARYVSQPMPLPVTSNESFVERFWSGVNSHTRAIFISHITSATALTFPLAEIARRARQAGILCIVDGAHAPGQIPLDLRELGVDIYAGACHKWLCAPKGAAFLYARSEVQDWLDPLVVSWGYEAEKSYQTISPFVDYHEWQGTRDMSAFLSVPAAIQFQQEHEWVAVRRDCQRLASQTRQRIDELTGLEPACPDPCSPLGSSYPWFTQMFVARLPQETDLETLKRRLYDEYFIEVPMILWNDQKFIRVSIQGYNTQADVDALIKALAVLL